MKSILALLLIICSSSLLSSEIDEVRVFKAKRKMLGREGPIMIHGYPNKPKPLFKFLERIGLIKLVNWTAGCIAVDNQEMDEVFKNIDVPIPITIMH